jgi:4-carboxymuconolactone decarboxylase
MRRIFFVSLSWLLCSAFANAVELTPTKEDHRARGVAALEIITGGGTAKLVEGLQDLAPELSDWVIDFAYGDVVSRPQLDLRTRELATVAALTALGNAPPQLRAHIKGALNAGCTPREVLEVVLQMSVYAGFPAALNGVAAVREVFTERGIKVPH